MKNKIFEIVNNNIEIYIKIPKFVNFNKFYKTTDEKYKKINKVKFEKYIGCKLDEKGKYLILIFVLRDYDEIYRQNYSDKITEEDWKHIPSI